jgi:hypothetical protein
MKKLIIFFAVLFAFSLTSCTDLISEDDETILQTQAIDKDDSVNPGGSGQGGEEGENEEG